VKYTQSILTDYQTLFLKDMYYVGFLKYGL